MALLIGFLKAKITSRYWKRWQLIIWSHIGGRGEKTKKGCKKNWICILLTPPPLSCMGEGNVFSIMGFSPKNLPRYTDVYTLRSLLFIIKDQNIFSHLPPPLLVVDMSPKPNFVFSDPPRVFWREVRNERTRKLRAQPLFFGKRFWRAGAICFGTIWRAKTLPNFDKHFVINFKT